MSIIDIVLIALGITAVIIYLILKILQTKKYNKMYKEQIKAGKTPEQARQYCDSLIGKQPKNKKDTDNDTPFEE